MLTIDVFVQVSLFSLNEMESLCLQETAEAAESALVVTIMMLFFCMMSCFLVRGSAMGQYIIVKLDAYEGAIENQHSSIGNQDSSILVGNEDSSIGNARRLRVPLCTRSLLPSAAFVAVQSLF